MEKGLLHAHSFLAYLVLAIVILATANAFIGWFSNKKFTEKDRKISLFALIFSHTQLLVGILLYAVSGWYRAFPEGMKDSVTRLKMLEHPLVNIIAIVLITVAFSKHKKMTNDTKKFKTIAIFYGIALILFLSRIPWNQWL